MKSENAQLLPILEEIVAEIRHPYSMTSSTASVEQKILALLIDVLSAELPDHLEGRLGALWPTFSQSIFTVRCTGNVGLQLLGLRGLSFCFEPLLRLLFNERASDPADKAAALLLRNQENQNKIFLTTLLEYLAPEMWRPSWNKSQLTFEQALVRVAYFERNEQGHQAPLSTNEEISKRLGQIIGAMAAVLALEPNRRAAERIVNKAKVFRLVPYRYDSRAHLEALDKLDVVANERRLVDVFVPRTVRHDRTLKNGAERLSFDDVFSSARRIQLYGQGGEGKTWLLKYIAITQARAIKLTQIGAIPVFISLRDYEPTDGLKGLIMDALGFDERELKEFVTGHRGEGWIFLFDGLDELPEHQAEKAKAQIRRWVDSQCPLARIVVSTRPGESIDLSGSTTVYLNPFDADQIELALNRLGEAASFIHERLSRDAELRRLSETPYHLGVIFQVLSKDPSIEGVLGLILRRFLDDVWERERLRGGSPAVSSDAKESILIALASQMFERRQRYLTLVEALASTAAVLSTPWQKADKSEAAIAELLSLRILERKGNHLSFDHDILRRYYLALKLARTIEESAGEPWPRLKSIITPSQLLHLSGEELNQILNHGIETPTNVDNAALVEEFNVINMAMELIPDTNLVWAIVTTLVQDYALLVMHGCQPKWISVMSHAVRAIGAQEPEDENQVLDAEPTMTWMEAWQWGVSEVALDGKKPILESHVWLRVLASMPNALNEEFLDTLSKRYFTPHICNLLLERSGSEVLDGRSLDVTAILTNKSWWGFDLEDQPTRYPHWEALCQPLCDVVQRAECRDLTALFRLKDILLSVSHVMAKTVPDRLSTFLEDAFTAEDPSDYGLMLLTALAKDSRASFPLTTITGISVIFEDAETLNRWLDSVLPNAKISFPVQKSALRKMLLWHIPINMADDPTTILKYCWLLVESPFIDDETFREGAHRFAISLFGTGDGFMGYFVHPHIQFAVWPKVGTLVSLIEKGLKPYLERESRESLKAAWLFRVIEHYIEKSAHPFASNLSDYQAQSTSALNRCSNDGSEWHSFTSRYEKYVKIDPNSLFKVIKPIEEDDSKEKDEQDDPFEDGVNEN